MDAAYTKYGLPDTVLGKRRVYAWERTSDGNRRLTASFGPRTGEKTMELTMTEGDLWHPWMVYRQGNVEANVEADATAQEL